MYMYAHALSSWMRVPAMHPKQMQWMRWPACKCMCAPCTKVQAGTARRMIHMRRPPARLNRALRVLHARCNVPACSRVMAERALTLSHRSAQCAGTATITASANRTQPAYLTSPPGCAAFRAWQANKARRITKTHLPATSMPYHPKAKFVYVARDGRDVCFSAHNHFLNVRSPVRACVRACVGTNCSAYLNLGWMMARCYWASRPTASAIYHPA